jgi:hypothetical protein
MVQPKSMTEPFSHSDLIAGCRICGLLIAREEEGPASRVAATPPEPPDDGDEALPEKRKPK